MSTGAQDGPGGGGRDRAGSLLDPDAFLVRLGGTGPLFGLDLGTKTIGIAVADDRWTIASPLTTIRRRKFAQDAAELLALAGRYRVKGLVLGLPINMDGTAGPRVQATKAFARNLSALTDLPLMGWDERLSTAAAERALIAADASRARRAEVIDSLAASYILEGALDLLRRRRPGSAAAPYADPGAAP